MKGTDGDWTSRSLPFILEGMTLVIFSDQLRSKYILLIFPGTVSRGISLPLDKILKVSSLTQMAMINDGFNFILFFPINDVRGRARKVVSVLVGLFERRQEPGVEDVMDGPGRG